MTEFADIVKARQGVGEYGPMLGKQAIDVSALLADYEPGVVFTITAVTAGAIHYEDGMGNEHTETFTDGQVVTGGEPGSAFPIPMYCRKIFRTGSTADCMVAFGP